MAKPENPGQGNGNGNQGNEGADDPASVLIVVTEEETHRYEGTSQLAVTSDGALLVGKGPVAAFSSGTWLRAYVEPLEPVPAP